MWNDSSGIDKFYLSGKLKKKLDKMQDIFDYSHEEKDEMYGDLKYMIIV